MPFEVFVKGRRKVVSKPIGKGSRPGHRLHAIVRREIARLFLEGKSIRVVARTVGVSKGAAKRYRPHGLPLCACGAPSAHRGWCRVRFAASARRQQTLAELNRRRRDAMGNE